MLSEKAIREYREIYKKRFGKELSDGEVREEAGRLIRLFRVISRPIKEYEDKNNASN